MGRPTLDVCAKGPSGIGVSISPEEENTVYEKPMQKHSRHSGEQCKDLGVRRNFAFSRNCQPTANEANK